MTYEADNINHIPGPNEVNAAYADIQAHNKSHTGLGAGMVNIFKTMMDVQKADPDAPAEDIYNSVNDSLTSAAVEGDMAAEIEDMVHSDTFTRIGMKLAPHGAVLSVAGGERVTGRGLEPVIDNTELFKDYLDTLNPEDVQDGKMPILSAAVSGLSATVRTCFSPENRKSIPEGMQGAVTQVGEDALRTFLAIEPEYTRLGLDSESLRSRHSNKPEGQEYLWVSKGASQEATDSKAAHDTYRQSHRDADVFEDMENYVTYWGKDLLPEYIAADNRQYLDEPAKQGFGPAGWHQDGGQTKWPDALAFVHQLEREYRTKEFASEVRQRLCRSLDTAIAAIDKGEEPEYIVGQRADLANIRTAITGEDFDEEKFVKYTKQPEW